MLGAATPLRAVAGVARLASAVGPGERLLSGPLSPRREWSWARGDLATARAVAAELGASVNDVALACVTGGLRDLLLSRGTPVAGRTLRALVPVSLRHPGQRGSGGNLVSGVVVRLPVSEPDPVARVRSVHRSLRDAKDGTAALGPVAALGLVERLPEPLAAVLGRSAARSRHGWCATAVTNVPGPTGPVRWPDGPCWRRSPASRWDSGCGGGGDPVHRRPPALRRDHGRRGHTGRRTSSPGAPSRPGRTWVG